MPKTKITQKEAKAHGILMSSLNVFYKLENGDIIDDDDNIRAYGEEKNALIDALNLIDEYIFENISDNKEAKQLSKAFKILKNFILK